MKIEYCVLCNGTLWCDVLALVQVLVQAYRLQDRKKVRAGCVTVCHTDSEYIRRLALCGGQVDAHEHEDRRLLLAQIARIGNNINQIARRANENQFISSVDLEKVWEMLKEIQKEVSSVGRR